MVNADSVRSILETDQKLVDVVSSISLGIQSDAISELQKLVSEVDNADRKLKAQVRLAEMLTARGDKATAEPLISEILAPAALRPVTGTSPRVRTSKDADKDCSKVR